MFFPAARQSREVPDPGRVRPSPASGQGGRAMTTMARLEARLRSPPAPGQGARAMTPMARLEARLRSLSARERLLLLLCAAAVIAFAVVRWAGSPAVAEDRKAHARVPARP